MAQNIRAGGLITVLEKAGQHNLTFYADMGGNNAQSRTHSTSWNKNAENRAERQGTAPTFEAQSNGINFSEVFVSRNEGMTVSSASDVATQDGYFAKGTRVDSISLDEGDEITIDEMELQIVTEISGEY